jgi:glycosyltransferase involved in cell wall biosynthesis
VLDATILVPTHRHARLLPYALTSALAQEGASVEVFVVGDGVEDDTREAVAPFLDQGVRFYDKPKGARHGERHRHEALADATGRIVCYLSDDDLLLPHHVAEMSRLLADADFAHSAPFVVAPDGVLRFAAVDLSEPGFFALLRTGDWNRISLTGAAHTLDAYRRLPHGWRPAPPGVPTDLHMWRQFLELPGLRARTGSRVTALHLPDPSRSHLSADERARELESWWTRSRRPGFEEELERLACNATRRLAVSHELHLQSLKRAFRQVRSTRWWRLRMWLGSTRMARALLARRKAA